MLALNLSFPEPLEREFREHYRKTFIYHLRFIWTVAAFIWPVIRISDAIAYPRFQDQIYLFLFLCWPLIILTALATWFPKTSKGFLHWLAAASATFTGCCMV